MRSVLLIASALLLASAASASGTPSPDATPAAQPAPVAESFEYWLDHPAPLFTARPPRDSLIAWHARAEVLRARREAPLAAEWWLDTAATHIHLELPRRLRLTGDRPALLSQVVDLDGDAFPEVVSVSPNSDTVTVHMDVLADDVERRVALPLPGRAFGMAVGDLDRDGLPDLVCSTWNPDGLVILRGLGGSAFAPAVTYSAGPGARGLALADLDGDGDLDIALTCVGDGTVRVFLGGGDGAFDAGVTCQVGAGPAAVLAVDVTGDGQPDLVSMNQGLESPSEMALSCLVNLGGGEFGPRVTSVLPWGPHAIAAGDLDGDGQTDVAMSGSGGSLVLLGDGTGRFVVGLTLSTHGDRDNGGVAIADLDGDGRLDVVVGEEALRGHGGAAHFGAVHVHRGLDGGEFEVGPGYRTVYRLQSLSLGDLDRDGLPDVLAAGASFDFLIDGPPGVTVLLQRPDHQLSGLAEYGMPQFDSSYYSNWIFSVRALRLGDSVDDLLAATYGRIQIMLNQGARGFTAPVEVGTGAVCAVRDLDLDDLDDVLVQSGDTLGVLRGGAGHTLAPGLWALSGYFYLAVGQFGGDAFPDLVVHDESGALFLAHGVSGGGFAAPVPTGTALPVGPDPYYGLRGLAGNGVDLDRDGMDEFVVFRLHDYSTWGWTAPDTLDVFRCLTSGALERLAMVAVPWPSLDYHWHDFPDQILSADFDGDGWRDLLAVRDGPHDPTTSGSYCALMNRGDGSLRVAECGRTNHGLAEAAIADLDNDQRDDVLFSVEHSMDTGFLQWLVSNGDGTFAMGQRNDVGDYLTSVTAGHFDEDSRLDVAVALAREVVVGVILNGTPWPDQPTPALAALVSASVEAGVARLVWSIDAAPSTEAVVLRSEGAAWVERARLHPDGTGRVRFEDAEVTPGARYGYRLAFAERGTLVVVSETWLEVPAAATLALAGAAPNPAVGELTVAFSLAGRAPASLTGYDVSGRRVAEREVGALGPGAHRVRLAAAGELPAGLYFIRLATPERTLFARAVLVR